MNYIKARKHALAGGHRTTVSTALAAGLSLALPASPAAASEGAPAATRLGAVQVRAEVDEYLASPKFTQPLQDTPRTIQVVEGTLFNQQGATTLTEALRNAPAVGTFHAGENGNTTSGDAIQMRGFDSSGSIFVDGVRDLGSVSRDLFNTEAVELTKGPAGTDNGRTAPTGAINMVSKQAFLQDALEGTVSGGIDGQRRITADWNQTLGSLPGSALRFNAMWQDSGVAGRDHVNHARWGFAPALGIGLDGATRVHLNLYVLEQRDVPDGHVPTVGLPGWSPQPGLEALVGHPVDPENFYGTRQDHDKVSARMATLRLEHDFSGALRLSNVLRWGRNRQDYLLTAFMGTSANVGAADPADLSTYLIARSLNTFKDQHNEILTNQLNLRADFSTGGIEHQLSTGLELIREELLAHGIAATGTRPPASLYAPDWNDAGDLAWARDGSASAGRTDTVAVYVFDTLRFSERWLVTAGLRADRHETQYSSTAICNNGTGRGAVPCGEALPGSLVSTADLAARDTLFNWQLGAVYKPVPALSLYAHYALSQQPPGGASFELSSSATSANNPNLDPQQARTFELGGKWSLLDHALSLNLTFFRTEVSNEINTQDPTDIQSGEKRVKGVEVSATGFITPRWALTAGYTYQDAVVTHGSSATQDGVPELPYTPAAGFTVWTTYQLPAGLSVGGGARYVGGLHRQNDGAQGTPKVTGGYTVFDLMAAWAVTSRATLRLNAYNLGDKQAVAGIVKSAYRYQPLPARTLLFSADLRF